VNTARSHSEGPGTGVPQCHDEVCITCSDTAEEEVSVALVSAGIGDTILVHAREAIAVVR
jgi:hypothetical protein